jgi:hypothetical protein
LQFESVPVWLFLGFVLLSVLIGFGRKLPMSLPSTGARSPYRLPQILRLSQAAGLTTHAW